MEPIDFKRKLATRIFRELKLARPDIEMTEHDFIERFPDLARVMPDAIADSIFNLHIRAVLHPLECNGEYPISVENGLPPLNPLNRVAEGELGTASYMVICSSLSEAAEMPNQALPEDEDYLPPSVRDYIVALFQLLRGLAGLAFAHADRLNADPNEPSDASETPAQTFESALKKSPVTLTIKDDTGSSVELEFDFVQDILRAAELAKETKLRHPLPQAPLYQARVCRFSGRPGEALQWYDEAYRQMAPWPEGSGLPHLAIEALDCCSEWGLRTHGDTASIADQWFTRLFDDLGPPGAGELDADSEKGWLDWYPDGDEAYNLAQVTSKLLALIPLLTPDLSRLIRWQTRITSVLSGELDGLAGRALEESVQSVTEAMRAFARLMESRSSFGSAPTAEASGAALATVPPETVGQVIDFVTEYVDEGFQNQGEITRDQAQRIRLAFLEVKEKLTAGVGDVNAGVQEISGKLDDLQKSVYQPPRIHRIRAGLRDNQLKTIWGSLDNKTKNHAARGEMHWRSYADQGDDSACQDAIYRWSLAVEEELFHRATGPLAQEIAKAGSLVLRISGRDCDMSRPERLTPGGFCALIDAVRTEIRFKNAFQKIVRTGELPRLLNLKDELTRVGDLRNRAHHSEADLTPEDAEAMRELVIGTPESPGVLSNIVSVFAQPQSP